MSFLSNFSDRITLGADYSRVNNLVNEILAVVKRVPPNENVQIPLKDEKGVPYPDHVHIAIKRIIERNPGLRVLSFGSSLTICRRYTADSMDSELKDHLMGKGLLFSQENIKDVELFPDMSAAKSSSGVSNE